MKIIARFRAEFFRPWIRQLHGYPTLGPEPESYTIEVCDFQKDTDREPRYGYRFKWTNAQLSKSSDTCFDGDYWWNSFGYQPCRDINGVIESCAYQARLVLRANGWEVKNWRIASLGEFDAGVIELKPGIADELMKQCGVRLEDENGCVGHSTLRDR